MSTVFSTKYPPKSRPESGRRSLIEIEIVWDGASRVMDMNEATEASHRENLPLGEPCAVSDLSGKPAYRYLSSEVELSLTRDELYRFMRHNLDSKEFIALAEKFGVFFEIHDDFYDEATGVALQPHYAPREAETFFQKCLRGDEEPEALDDYIEAWHTAPEDDVPLHRFLGMTWEEYGTWLVEPSLLAKLMFDRLRFQGTA